MTRFEPATAALVGLPVAMLALACQSSRYRIERRLDCDDANAQIHRALVARDYEITRFELAEPGGAGVVDAERMTPEGRRHGSVRVLCDHTVVFQPVEGAWFLPDYEFSREVYYALLVQAAPAAGTGDEVPRSAAPAAASDRDRAAAAGRLDVVLRPLDRFEIRKQLDVDLEGWGLYVVHVRITNGTRRTFALPPNAVALVDEQGERVVQLTAAGIEAVLRRSAAAPRDPDAAPLPSLDVACTARALDARTLPSGRVASGKTHDGFLYFPERPYRSARLRLVDEETGEVEGTVVGL